MAKRRQEAALRALLTAPTIKEAAESSGIGQSTLFRYLQNNEFRKRYQEAKRFLLDQALSDLQRAASEAVATLRRVMADQEASAGAQVAAARAILAYAIETAQLEDVLRRLERLEEALKR